MSTVAVQKDFMWHVFELSLSVFGCFVSRWRGASSHSTPAYAWHPRRRQLSGDPRDEATSGRSHEEAGISGTGYTFTFQNFTLTDRTRSGFKKKNLGGTFVSQ